MTCLCLLVFSLCNCFLSFSFFLFLCSLHCALQRGEHTPLHLLALGSFQNTKTFRGRPTDLLNSTSAPPLNTERPAVASGLGGTK